MNKQNNLIFPKEKSVFTLLKFSLKILGGGTACDGWSKYQKALNLLKTLILRSKRRGDHKATPVWWAVSEKASAFSKKKDGETPAVGGQCVDYASTSKIYRVQYIFVLIFILSLFSAPLFAKTEFSVSYMDKAPVIDGKIDMGEWTSATGLCGFHVLGFKDNAPDETIVYMGYDDEKLYIAYKAYQKTFPQGADKGLNGEYYVDDTVEVFFNDNLKKAGTEAGYFQFLLNSHGFYSVVTYVNATKSPLDIEYKTFISPEYGKIGAAKEDLYYQGEMSVTWKSMKVSAPTLGQEGQCLVARDHVTGETYNSNFGYFHGSFHELSNYPLIHFTKDMPNVSLLPNKHLGSKLSVWSAKENTLDFNWTMKQNDKPMGEMNSELTFGNDGDKEISVPEDLPKGIYTMNTTVKDKKTGTVLLSLESEVFNLETISVNYDKENKRLVCDLDYQGLNFSEFPFVEISLFDGADLICGFITTPTEDKLSEQKIIDLSKVKPGKYTVHKVVKNVSNQTEDIEIL